MKTFSLVALAAMASTALADVQLFTDTQCMSNDYLLDTHAGTCYEVPGGKLSALGCSVGHNLRVYAGSGCGGNYADKSPQHCVNLGGQNILSLKCL